MKLKVNEKIYGNAGNQNVISFIEKKESFILDIGCGAGDNAKILKNLGHHVDGITLSESEKLIASNYCDEIFIHNLENGLPNEIKDKKYDYIICSHVLEHIAFPTKSLDDLYNLAIKNSSTVVIMLLKGDFEYTNDGIMDYTHLRWYTLKSATNLFQSYGFEIDTSRVEGFLPFHSFLSKLKESQYNILKKILYKTSPTFWGSELVFSLKIK
jgi:ubiquinone/menaquinone biosynthesis C-methylase UbiE